MNALISACAMAALTATGAAALASETMTLDPRHPAPQQANTRPAAVENLSGKTRCEIALVPNGVVQFTSTCRAWPLVAQTKMWKQEEGRMLFMDGQGRPTLTFYPAGKDIYVTGRAEPEFLRLTILPPPSQLKLQPSAPLTR